MKSIEPLRAKSALERKWIRYGNYSYVCGEFTATRFMVVGEEKVALYKQNDRVGIFPSFKNAFDGAKNELNAGVTGA